MTPEPKTIGHTTVVINPAPVGLWSEAALLALVCAECVADLWRAGLEWQAGVALFCAAGWAVQTVERWRR